MKPVPHELQHIRRIRLSTLRTWIKESECFWSEHNARAKACEQILAYAKEVVTKLKGVKLQEVFQPVLMKESDQDYKADWPLRVSDVTGVFPTCLVGAGRDEEERLVLGGAVQGANEITTVNQLPPIFGDWVAVYVEGFNERAMQTDLKVWIFPRALLED